MSSIDDLAPDQRAVLDLVLQRGRSYDDIARLLGIDRAGVRSRALAAFDELGPDTGVATESRALIADYLLGQLPEGVAEQTRERLARSPHERAWARVLASELAPMAAQPLPEIPDGSRAAAAPAPAATSASAPAATSALAGANGEPERAASPSAAPADAPPGRRPEGERGGRRAPRLSDRPSSRRGGAVMLGIGALVAVALVVVLISVLGGGSSKHASTAPSASGAGRTTTSGTTTSGTTPQAQVVAQVNLNPPSAGSAAKGVGFVVKSGSAYGIIIQAQHIAPNNHNAYAAWLYNSPTDASFLGFVKPGVGKNGQLQTGGGLPTNAGHFKQLLLTLESGATTPKSPGTIVLQGPFSGVPVTG